MVPGTEAADDRLYFRQLLSGQDFAQGDQIATQMRNFAYLVGDVDRRECFVIDPAYAPSDLVRIAEDEGFSIVGALISHYHADHCGGSMMGLRLDGIAELLEHHDVPIIVNRAESRWIEMTTGVSSDHFKIVDGGERVAVGAVEIDCLHTPGHTPGSQCFRLHDRLVSGDTLFLDGCGRTDLPGGDPSEIYKTLQRLAQLPDDLDLYPGHFYSSKPFADLGGVKRSNMVFRAKDQNDWLRLFS